MFGNGLSRNAIVNGRALLALWLGKPFELSDAARDLCDMPTWRAHHHAMMYGETFDALDGAELEDVVAFFLMLDAHARSTGKGNEHATDVADDYANAHAIDGVMIHVKNSDDDPTRLDFLIISSPIAGAWAERRGSLDGGTWECCDGEEFVYDTGCWREGFIEELQKDGYRLDLSEYSDPDEDDLRAARHARNCDACDGDFHRAKEHIESAPLDRGAHVAAFSRNPDAE